MLLDAVEDRLDEVNEHLYQTSLKSGAVTGSTVAVLIALERHVLSLWAGDSRIYRARGRQLVQITHDHSETQERVDQGLIPPSEADQAEGSNVITRAVGGAPELFLDIELTELCDGDTFLLCTDGLYRELTKSTLLLHLSGSDPEAMCGGLISEALEGRCRDNASAVVVRFSGT
jgi:serine/threonine protein phosphatase PrpC